MYDSEKASKLRLLLMGRMKFSPDGKLVGIDGEVVDYSSSSQESNGHLSTSASLEFLKNEQFENIFEKEFWSLRNGVREMAPLKFSNDKTQEDIVKEIVSLIKSGKKVIFLHGVCGTGKSAIALNIARALGKASIVVPIKNLQKQYEEEYMGKKYLIKSNGQKMKIAMITGRENHDSVYDEGKSCADPFLPDTIKISEKNLQMLKQYYRENPFISNGEMPPLRSLRRISIAPANPHWSPILPASIELNQLKDAKKKRYKGVGGKEYILYHRKPGCSYYDQYLSYIESDVIIFNSAKYLAEFAMGRKPMCEVDIFDEADEFLDSFSTRVDVNLTRFYSALNSVVPDSEKAKASIDKILSLVEAEEKNKKAVGIDSEAIFHLRDTNIGKIFDLLLADSELQSEIMIDESNYSNVVLEAARTFKESEKDTYVNFKKEEDSICAGLVTTNLSQKFNEIVDGSKAVVLMSGTLHSEEVVRKVFGISDFALVEAETMNQGSIEICRTGKEMDCKYSNFQNGKNSREKYLHALSAAIEKSIKPTLVHVNAYNDLPSKEEIEKFSVKNIMSREELLQIQGNDKRGGMITKFRRGEINILFTTRCARGVDFPGKMCNSVVFTKFPNPDVKGTFWKILQRTHPDYFWELYRDKARREFLQRIYRAVRSINDHVFVLSPDLRVIDAVREIQLKMTD